MVFNTAPSARRIILPLLGAVLLLSTAKVFANPSAVAPYTLRIFNRVPPKGATQPDDLAVDNDNHVLWVGYQNNADTTGKRGNGSLVEYDLFTGNVLKNIPIPGHIDGLKIVPITHNVWTTQNEDANPVVTIVNATTGAFKSFSFPDSKAGPLTGGMDDLTFLLTNPNIVFIVASSQQTPVGLPVIVEVNRAITPNAIPFLMGNPHSVLNVVTNTVETSDQIGDPDSMTLDPAGELVLDNRSDDSLYIVRNPNSAEPVLRVPLTLNGSPVEVNDTIFTTSTFGVSSTAGTIFITDNTANTIYTLTKPYFPANEVYTAANVVGDVGLVDLNSGEVTPVAKGFAKVQGLAFSPRPVAIP